MPSRFDVVFSDVVMPGMNGVDLGQRSGAAIPDLPVVLDLAATAMCWRKDGTHGFELLHKPYSVEGLSRVLRSSR